MINAVSSQQSLEDFNRVYGWMIAQAEEWLNQSDNWTIAPAFVLVPKDKSDIYYIQDAREVQAEYGFAVNDVDLRTLVGNEGSWILFLIYMESVWNVVRVVEKSKIHQTPLDASTQEDRQRCVQIRIATGDVFAVANCPLCFTYGGWTLKKTQLVFPRMALNGSGEVTYRSGADA